MESDDDRSVLERCGPAADDNGRAPRPSRRPGRLHGCLSLRRREFLTAALHLALEAVVGGVGTRSLLSDYPCLHRHVIATAGRAVFVCEPTRSTSTRPRSNSVTHALIPLIRSSSWSPVDLDAVMPRLRRGCHYRGAAHCLRPIQRDADRRIADLTSSLFTRRRTSVRRRGARSHEIADGRTVVL